MISPSHEHRDVCHSMRTLPHDYSKRIWGVNHRFMSGTTGKKCIDYSVSKLVFSRKALVPLDKETSATFGASVYDEVYVSTAAD